MRFIETVVLILIIVGVVGGIFTVKGLLDESQERVEFCENQGGEYKDYGECLIEENGSLQFYNIVKFKDKWWLIDG